MKITCIAAVAALTVLVSSCKKDLITGSGEIKTEQRTLENFTNVSTEGSSKVHIVKGNVFEVKVKAYTNLLPYLETIVQNGKLSIRYKNTSSVRNDNSEIFITMPALTALSSYGSGDIDADGEFNGATDFNAEIRGSANISIAHGAAQKLVLQSSGSGNFKSFGLTAQHADIFISGSGNAEITVAQKLKAAINGSGNVYYKGTPSAIENNINGSGKVIKQ